MSLEIVENNPLILSCLTIYCYNNDQIFCFKFLGVERRGRNWNFKIINVLRNGKFSRFFKKRSKKNELTEINASNYRDQNNHRLLGFLVSCLLI